MGKVGDVERWAMPRGQPVPSRARSTFNLNEIDEEPKKIQVTLNRWFSNARINEDDKEELIENERERSRSRRRSSIKDDIMSFFNRRRTSLPVVPLSQGKDIAQSKKPKSMPEPIPIECEYSSDFSSSPPLAAFMIVDRSLLPPPPPPRRFSLGNLLKK